MTCLCVTNTFWNDSLIIVSISQSDKKICSHFLILFFSHFTFLTLHFSLWRNTEICNISQLKISIKKDYIECIHVSISAMKNFPSLLCTFHYLTMGVELIGVWQVKVSGKEGERVVWHAPSNTRMSLTDTILIQWHSYEAQVYSFYVLILKI